MASDQGTVIAYIRREQRSTNVMFLRMFMREVASSCEIRSGIWAQYWPGVDSNEKVTAGHGIEAWWSVKNVVKSKQTKKIFSNAMLQPQATA